MSVVAVKREAKKIIIAADNQVSYRSNKVDGNERGKYPAKLFQSGDIVFGTAGFTEVSSMFRLYCLNSKPAGADEISILNFLADFTEWAKKKNSDFKLDNDFIIIYKNEIFVTSGLEVSSVEEYTAIGSGMFLALGAMYMGADAEKAIDVAKKYDLYCGGETQKIEVTLQKE